MRDEIKQACEEIDAAMFSSDTFRDKGERDWLMEYIGRWMRKMQKWEEVVVQDDAKDFESQDVQRLKWQETVSFTLTVVDKYIASRCVALSTNWDAMQAFKDWLKKEYYVSKE